MDHEEMIVFLLVHSCGGRWRIKDEGEKDRNVSLVLGMMIE
jgi:hypothetical protein